MDLGSTLIDCVDIPLTLATAGCLRCAIRFTWICGLVPQIFVIAAIALLGVALDTWIPSSNHPPPPTLDTSNSHHSSELSLSPSLSFSVVLGAIYVLMIIIAVLAIKWMTNRFYLPRCWRVYVSLPHITTTPHNSQLTHTHCPPSYHSIAGICLMLIVLVAAVLSLAFLVAGGSGVAALGGITAAYSAIVVAIVAVAVSRMWATGVGSNSDVYYSDTVS